MTMFKIKEPATLLKKDYSAEVFPVTFRYVI